jgi:hypothetical protein
MMPYLAVMVVSFDRIISSLENSASPVSSVRGFFYVLICAAMSRYGDVKTRWRVEVAHCRTAGEGHPAKP